MDKDLTANMVGGLALVAIVGGIIWYEYSQQPGATPMSAIRSAAMSVLPFSVFNGSGGFTDGANPANTPSLSFDPGGVAPFYMTYNVPSRPGSVPLQAATTGGSMYGTPGSAGCPGCNGGYTLNFYQPELS